MLFYLDNWVSVRADSTVPRGPRAGRRGGLNENYARELMEFHTLGVDGGYTQQDVIEVARAFTGWSIEVAVRHLGVPGGAPLFPGFASNPAAAPGVLV